MKSFEGKVAVVTGGGGNGIGNALVTELARNGAAVACCDVKGLDKTRQELETLGVDHYAEHVDMADKAAIDTFLDHVVARFGQLDLLVNNAGIPLGDLTFEEVTPRDFERITEVNYWGVIHTTQRAYPHLLARPEAAIVNISSSQGILALPYLVPYCTTKFAVRGFTDSLRAEHRIRGIDHVTVHTVHPGAVATDITLNADYHNSSTQRFHEDLQKGDLTARRRPHHPPGRTPQPGPDLHQRGPCPRRLGQAAAHGQHPRRPRRDAAASHHGPLRNAHGP